MIKKAQVSFITITMSILLVFFAVVGVGIYYILHQFAEQSIDKLLNDTFVLYTDVGTSSIQSKSFVATLNYHPQTDDYTYRYWFDGETFNEQDVVDVISVATSVPYPSGNLDVVYFKKVPFGNQNSFILVGADASQIFELLSTNLTNCIIILGVVYLVLLFIVYRISFLVFAPIRVMFNKQKQFISDASHELKTPLSIISANAEVIKSKESDVWSNNIITQTQRMNVLVSDLLTLTKLDEGKKKVSAIEFDLSHETLNSTLQFDAVAFEKGKTIATDVADNIKIFADLHAFKQVMSILLDNAVKYANSNSEITVTLKKENGKTVLTVKNLGSDVPNADSSKIFERFYRGDLSRSRESGGSGLGLSIAKNICDVNKWKISAISHLNESMTITIVF